MAFSSYRRKLYDPLSSEPYKISRSKIDLFLECPRCFYMNERLGVKRPSTAPFTLNVAVDGLLKKEFDIHRAKKEAHPLMKKYGVDAIPFSHKDIDVWRENFVGVRFLETKTNLLIFGAVDDVWVNSTNELIVVDYKATAKDGKVDKLEDTRWHNQYRRQMEVYQWLLRNNGFSVSNTGYFVYVNGRKDKEAFDGKLEFDVALIAYTGDGSWINKTIIELKSCLDGELPMPHPECEYCIYRKSSALVAEQAKHTSKYSGASDKKAEPIKKIRTKKITGDSHTNKDETSTLF